MSRSSTVERAPSRYVGAIPCAHTRRRSVSVYLPRAVGRARAGVTYGRSKNGMPLFCKMIITARLARGDFSTFVHFPPPDERVRGEVRSCYALLRHLRALLSLSCSMVVSKVKGASLTDLLDRVDSHNTAAGESPHERRSPRGTHLAASTGRLPPLGREPGHTAVRLTPSAHTFAWTDPMRNHMRASTAAATRANSTKTTEQGARRPVALKSSDPNGVWSRGGALGTLSCPRGKLRGATSLATSLG